MIKMSKYKISGSFESILDHQLWFRKKNVEFLACQWEFLYIAWMFFDFMLNLKFFKSVLFHAIPSEKTLVSASFCITLVLIFTGYSDSAWLVWPLLFQMVLTLKLALFS